MNYCDFGHETTEDIRRLPIGEQSGIFVCRKHYREQVAAWKRDGQDTTDVPAWEDLPKYED